MCSPVTVRCSDSSPLRRMSVGPLQWLLQGHKLHSSHMTVTYMTWCYLICVQMKLLTLLSSRSTIITSRSPSSTDTVSGEYHCLDSHQHLQPGAWSFLCTRVCMCVCMCRREKRKYIRTIQAALLASLASDAAPDCIHFSCCSPIVYTSADCVRLWLCTHIYSTNILVSTKVAQITNNSADNIHTW